jgi:3-hydroxybutyryl-CoA dehydratase
MKKLSIQDFSVGQKATLTKVVTKEDVHTFASITGDTNPVHLDETFAKETSFGACIAHGIFSAGLISAVLGTKLPGPGGIYVSQSLRFLRPVFIGDEVTASVEITSINLTKKQTLPEDRMF